ncbi:tRNA uridine(34) 5-carboxymethylaminomethyl modification radical SAM/GNAT enzyme Elp3 [Candidatus Pacearchaeota archaeon]|nr:tRNA uridine(34) 5-carboxymethylaminomethyl modification radical SAM/GNAT enzyme Elp3 [Candidatus Pacearchaeota archaeon]
MKLKKPQARTKSAKTQLPIPDSRLTTPSRRKPTKTLSGVAPLAVMLPPRPCNHGTCLYCPSFNAPQSYTPESPAVLRAKECGYDPIKQINARLKAFKAMGHPTEKIELIIMGGTFLSYPEEFQFDFIKKCYDALNRKKSKSLAEAKKINETTKHRCVALCIETRPDVCTDYHINNMLEWGATRVELGVQAIDDEIYKKVNRGHTVQDVINATARLKKAGFKIGYHLMPGIPGSNPKKDIQMFKKIFSSQKFKPDQIKIYPCQVLKGAGLRNLYYGGEYIPYTKQQATEIIIQMLKLTPRYCRIMRIMREIPPSYLIAGIKNIDMRHDIESKIRVGKKKESSYMRSFHGSPKQVFLLARNFFFLKRKKSINEIRFREIGFAIRDKRKIDTKIKIKTTKYKASNGTEFFIEAINKDNILFGLLRLRLDKNFPAMIRELHVYGPALNITPTPDSQLTTHDLKIKTFQHKGLGKQLMQEAEKIAKKKGYKNIRVISGVGVREYYKKLGYKLDKEKIYVEKGL